MKAHQYVAATVVTFLVISCISFAETIKHAKTVRPTNVHQQPQMTSPTIYQMAKDQPVTIKKRERAWYLIDAPDSKFGWLKMLNVRFEANKRRDGELGLQRMFDSVSSRVLPTQSTGVRGFDQADLLKAAENHRELEKLLAQNLPKEALQRFVEQGKLKVNPKIKLFEALEE